MLKRRILGLFLGLNLFFAEAAWAKVDWLHLANRAAYFQLPQKCALFFKRFLPSQSKTSARYKSLPLNLFGTFYDFLLPTHYLRDIDRENFKLHFHRKSEKWGYHLEEGEFSPLSPGSYTFVMTPDGVMYASPHNRSEWGGYYHSELLAGQASASSGVIVVTKDGFLTEFYPETGHYTYLRDEKSDKLYIQQFKEELLRRGDNPQLILIKSYKEKLQELKGRQKDDGLDPKVF